jgi:hypothetical protein
LVEEVYPDRTVVYIIERNTPLTNPRVGTLIAYPKGPGPAYCVATQEFEILGELWHYLFAVCTTETNILDLSATKALRVLDLVVELASELSTFENGEGG